MATAINEQEVRSHLHPVPSWNLAEHPMPTGREEVWRFSPIKKMQGILDGQPSEGEINIVATLPEEVTFLAVDNKQGKSLAVEPPIDRVAALAFTNSKDSRVLSIPAGKQLADPIQLDIHGEGLENSFYQHFVIDVGPGAKAQINLLHSGLAKLATKIDLRVGDNAELDFVSVQDWQDGSVHGGQISILVGRDARVKTVQASLGGGVTRIVERTSYAGPGGEIEQFGIYFVNGDRHIEHRMFVDHNQPKTQSHADYRGALQYQGARSVWVGDVLIRPEALGINTYESNKNLILTDGCQADSVPNLEIETGNIEGAGHSSSTGRFDEQQLFYLRSRGIDEDEARRLLVQGFFNEIIRRIGITEVEDRLHEVLDKELAS